MPCQDIIEYGDYVRIIYNDNNSSSYVGIISMVTEVDYYNGRYPYTLEGVENTSFSSEEVRLVAKRGAVLFRPTQEEEKAVQPVEWSFKNQIEEDLKKLNSNEVGF